MTDKNAAIAEFSRTRTEAHQAAADATDAAERGVWQLIEQDAAIRLAVLRGCRVPAKVRTSTVFGRLNV